MNDLSTDLQAAESGPTRMDLIMLDPDKMAALVRFSELMASSVVSLPKHFHGKPADCFAVCLQAAEWRMNPFAVAQKTHVINGALGYEAQLIIAVLRATGAVASRPHYEYRGSNQDLECRVGFVVAGETEITWNEWYAIRDVKVKNSPLWGTNPKQQLGYLQVKYWARQYAPGAVLGIRTKEELEEIAAEAEPAQPRGPRRKSEKTPLVERIDGDGVIHGAEGASGSTATSASAAAPAATKSSAPAQASAATSSGGALAAGQVAYLRNKLKAAGVSEQTICDRFQVSGIELLDVEQFDEVKAELLAMV